MTNHQFIADIGPIMRHLGSLHFATEASVATGARLGLDRLQWYVLGRGGVLGDVDPHVVASAFGYFNPALIARGWAGRSVCPPRVAAAALLATAADLGRERLATVDGLEACVRAMDGIRGRADADGLALFAGYQAEPLVDDLLGRAMQLIVVLREHRGSAHLVALRAAGVPSRTAHFVKQPDDLRSYGWRPEDAPLVTDDTLAALDRAETITNAIVGQAYAGLDDDAAAALLDGLHGIAAACAA